MKNKTNKTNKNSNLIEENISISKEQTSIKNEEFVFSKYLIFLIVLIEGFVSIGIEITAIRKMIPYGGSNITNTSIIIGIFLFFLSIGYYKGGIITKNQDKILLKNLLFSTLIIAIGFNDFFIFHLFTNFKIDELYQITIYSLIVIAPITYFLGQTVPIITNFINWQEKAKINGTLLFLSTIGSFLGSIGTTLILMNFLGVQKTIFVYVLLLSLLLILLIIFIKTKIITKIITIFCILISLSITIFSFKFNPYVYSNQYSDVIIDYEDNLNKLIINHGYSSNYAIEEKSSTFPYIKKMEFLIKNLDNNKKDILVIGAGGFTLSLNDNLNKYTYVDIDSKLKEVSENLFLKDKIKGEFIVADGRSYLLNNKNKWDIIVVDAFSNRNSIPSSLITKEFFELVKSNLKKDGYFFINLIGDSFIKNNYTKHFIQTINESFSCISNNLEETRVSNIENIVFTCTIKDNVIYTDNKINLFEIYNPINK